MNFICDSALLLIIKKKKFKKCFNMHAREGFFCDSNAYSSPRI